MQLFSSLVSQIAFSHVLRRPCLYGQVHATVDKQAVKTKFGDFSLLRTNVLRQISRRVFYLVCLFYIVMVAMIMCSCINSGVDVGGVSLPADDLWCVACFTDRTTLRQS